MDVLGKDHDRSRPVLDGRLEPVDPLVWDTDVQEEYLSMVTSYNDHADHDDAPDSLASMVREFFPSNVAKKPGISFFLPK